MSKTMKESKYSIKLEITFFANSDEMAIDMAQAIKNDIEKKVGCVSGIYTDEPVEKQHALCDWRPVDFKGDTMMASKCENSPYKSYSGISVEEVEDEYEDRFKDGLTAYAEEKAKEVVNACFANGFTETASYMQGGIWASFRWSEIFGEYTIQVSVDDGCGPYDEGSTADEIECHIADAIYDSARKALDFDDKTEEDSNKIPSPMYGYAFIPNA